MTWSEQGTRDVSAALAPYTIKSARAARNLVRAVCALREAGPAMTMDAGEGVAAALMTLRTAQRLDHPWETVFALIPAHPMARLGSAVDDAWLSALNRKDEAQ